MGISGVGTLKVADTPVMSEPVTTEPAQLSLYSTSEEDCFEDEACVAEGVVDGAVVAVEEDPKELAEEGDSEVREGDPDGADGNPEGDDGDPDGREGEKPKDEVEEPEL